VPRKVIFQKERTESPPIEAVRKLYINKPEPVLFPRRQFSAVEVNALWNAGNSDADSAGETLPELPFDTTASEGQVQDTIGSIVHLVLERSIIDGHPVLVTPPDLPSNLRKNIDEDILGEISRTAFELTERFFSGGLGAEMLAADWKEPELPFIYRLTDRDIYISGIMDIVFQNNGIITVLDFKTDKFMRPEEYYLQLGIYRNAAAELFPVTDGEASNIRTFIIYLRKPDPVPVPYDAEIEEKILPLIS
jgi:ATP-dependent exoDNAse (exonuclease V) beta subunit